MSRSPVNATLYVNNTTATNHNISNLSNGQYLVDGYFVIDKVRLESDFQIVPMTVAVLGVSVASLIPGEEFKSVDHEFLQPKFGVAQPYHTHSDISANSGCSDTTSSEGNAALEVCGKNIMNITSETTTARINAMELSDKPKHVRVTDTRLIPDGYYAVNLMIDNVDQLDIYKFHN